MKKIISILVLCISIVSCTDDFESINIDPTKPAAASLAPSEIINGHMKNAFTNGLFEGGEYQRVHSLYAHLYSQYFATTATYFGSDRYSINQGWLLFSWVRFYPKIIGSLAIVINNENASAEEKAIARIWKAFLFQRYVTLYGDIPYFNVLDPDLPEKYDPQPLIYDDLLKELADASSILSSSSVSTALASSDVIYGGSTAQWVKFANSLRLRLALRISSADPARAKTEGEAAIASGVFASNEENAYLPVDPTNYNQFNRINRWNEFRMSATMESLLAGYDDPRKEIFFSPATETGLYSGIRNGLPSSSLGATANIENSNVGPRFLRAVEAETKRIILTYAEQCFLLAEAKLNNWEVSGTAQEWYENGIEASIQQFSAAPDFAESQFSASSTDITDYIQGTSASIIPGGTENAGLTRGISSLPVAFSNVEIEQREQVGIQKWLALWPDGFEAWAEFRRTGLPKLYPVAQIDGGDVQLGEFIQRVPFLGTQKSVFPDAIQEATTRMGGDTQSTKLWFAGGN